MGFNSGFKGLRYSRDQYVRKKKQWHHALKLLLLTRILLEDERKVMWNRQKLCIQSVSQPLLLKTKKVMEVRDHWGHSFWEVTWRYFLTPAGAIPSQGVMSFKYIIIIIIYLSWSWATCWPVPVSCIQKSLQRSAMIPSASWGIAFHYLCIYMLYPVSLVFQ